MRSPRVCLEVVLDLGDHKCAVEGGAVGRRDARVIASKETEDRRAHPLGLFRRGRPDLVLALAEPAIEADDSREARLFGRGKESDAAAEAEAQHEYAASCRLGSEFRASGSDVREDTLWSRLTHVRHVLEVIGAPIHPCGPPEGVEGDRVNAGGRKPL